MKNKYKKLFFRLKNLHNRNIKNSSKFQLDNYYNTNLNFKKYIIMKKNYKKYIIIFIILLLIIWIWYFAYSKYYSNNSTDNKNIEFQSIETEVIKKTFDEEIEKSWSTKIKNEQRIKFNTTGRITEVNFKEWDSVKKWDIIVSVDSSKAKADINKAAIELDKAKRNFKKIVEDLTDSKLKSAIFDLELAKTSIENKEKDLVYLRKKQENDSKSKKNEIEMAKNNFIIEEAKIKKDLAISELDKKNLHSDNSIKEKNISYEKQKRDYEDFKNNFQSKVEKKINEYNLKLETTYYDLEKDVRDFEFTFSDMEDILWIRNWSFQYVNYFSARNNSNIWKIKENYYKAWDGFKKFKEAYKKISGKKDWKNIVKTLEASKDFYDNMYLALIYLQQGFEDSFSIENFNPSEYFTKFSGALARAWAMRTSIISLVDELKNYESEEKIKKDLQDELEKARIAIENSDLEIKKFLDENDFSKNTFDANQKNILISLDELKISMNQKILDFEKFEKAQKDEYRQAEIALEKEKISFKQQEEEFEKIKNISKNDEYISAEESIKQAELNLENAQKWLENYIILAPFDWIVTKNTYLVWDRITENSEQFVSIVDPKVIEILIDLNQSEILKTHKDIPVKITLDTYPENILDWKISEIDTSPKRDESTWISKFSAKVIIWDYGDLKLYTWMQASVKIKTNSIPETLVVPFSAVNSDDDGKKYVTAIENGKKVKKYVEVWFSDWEYYQILSWLKEWEKILEIDYDASKIKDENNFEWWYDKGMMG